MTYRSFATSNLPRDILLLEFISARYRSKNLLVTSSAQSSIASATRASRDGIGVGKRIGAEDLEGLAHRCTLGLILPGEKDERDCR